MEISREVQPQTYHTQTSSLSEARSEAELHSKAWSLIAIIGAGVIISLYLVVPLMIFFGGLHDWITQLLCALFVLTLGEFIICRILLKTARARKLHTQEMLAIQHSKHTPDSKAQNMPFNVLVDAETERFPLVRPQQSASSFEQDETVKMPVMNR